MIRLAVRQIRLLDCSTELFATRLFAMKLFAMKLFAMALFFCAIAGTVQAQGAVHSPGVVQASGAIQTQGTVQAQRTAQRTAQPNGPGVPSGGNLLAGSMDSSSMDRSSLHSGVEASGLRLATSAPVELRKPSRPIGELQSAQGRSRGSSSGLVSTLFSLGLVLGLFLATAALAHRYMKPPTKQELPSSIMEVLGSISLPTQPRQQAILMRLGQRVLLLSSHAGQTCTLAEFTDPDEVASLLAQCKSQNDGRDN